jgi:hypothetical protein
MEKNNLDKGLHIMECLNLNIDLKFCGKLNIIESPAYLCDYLSKSMFLLIIYVEKFF